MSFCGSGSTCIRMANAGPRCWSAIMFAHPDLLTLTGLTCFGATPDEVERGAKATLERYNR